MPGKTRHRRRLRRFLIRLTLLLALGALAAAAVWIFVLPYREAESTMHSGTDLILQHLDDGTVELSWPAAEKTDFYRVEVYHLVMTENEDGETEPEEQILFSEDVFDATCCILPELPAQQALTIRVNTMVGYDFPGEDKVRPGEQPLETTLNLTPPGIVDLTWEVDPETDTVTVNFAMHPGDSARLYRKDDTGQWQLLRTLTETQTTISFGTLGDLPMPEHGESCCFQLDSYREQSGSVYYSRLSEPITIIREDLLDRNLWVQLTDEGKNVCSMVWNETKGEYYELQMLNDATGEWETIHTEGQTGLRMFTTEHLKPFHTYSFRVIAKGGQAPLGKNAATSEIVRFRTAEAVLYSTIWPIKQLPVYSTPEMTESIGQVSGGATLCVVEEQDTCFGIRWEDGTTGYISSDYVMIDLVDYLGELCAYQITNSDSSIYMVSKYAIPHITGTVIVGYESVRMSDGTYLVPLLYPVAQRLLTAAQDAVNQGYRLKIYDSYRPNRATVMLYNHVWKLLEEPVPGNIPDPTEEDPERLLTFGTVMTNNGAYPLNYFLAQGVSLHNVGIAVDLTLESLDSGTDLPMQSAMHDLSQYSMNHRNNANAKTLKSIMEGAGFGGLVSEWWHFQDNEIRNKLSLPALWGGISPEGWRLSDGGWRYRKADGTYLASCSTIIGDREYTFDEHGFVVE